MKPGDKVRYRKIRETQHVLPDLRSAVYTVIELDNIGGNSGQEECAKVLTPWGSHTWIYTGWLEVMP